MFTKILIANRGEVAVRIIRACQEMDIRTVAVYSEADANTLHTMLADKSVCIGPPSPTQSYLCGDCILDVAKRLDCDAVHPGYGFLSENAGFAEAVRSAGLTFIGPSPEAMRIMGSKTSARAAMAAAGVPIVPGYQESQAEYCSTSSVATDRSRRGDGGRSAARLFCAALRPGPPRPAQRTVEHHLGPACRDPPQIGPTHALNPTADGGSAPRTPAPLLWCRAALAGRKAARAVLPALGGRAHPCARLGLAPVCVAALCWSPCGCGRAVGRVAAVLGGFSGRCVGVCGGFVLGGGFSGGGGFSWLCRGSAVGSVVASAGRVGAGRWGLPVARAGVCARVLRCRGRGGFGSAVAASAFASAWSGWVGFPLAVRRFAGAVWGVSVPVTVPPLLRLAAPGALPAVSVWARAA